MDDRRKLKRKYLVFFTRVFDLQSGKLLGQLADVTAQGAMIISGDPIQVENVYQLRMELPDDTFAADHMDFLARSVWSKPDIDPEFYNTGFQLIDPTPEQIQIIEQIIAKFGFRE